MNKIFFVFAAIILLTGCNDVKDDDSNKNLICEQDSDCVPEQCCHPTSCVNHNFKTSCTERFCTMDCKPGTMDCGQGSCVCENKKCSAKMESITQIANPASVYCEEKGNKLEIRTDEDGDQIGICILADGKECEEWKFFRGEC